MSTPKPEILVPDLATAASRLSSDEPIQALVAHRWLSTTGAVLTAVTVLSTAVSALGVWWADPVAVLVVAACALALAITLVRQ